MHTTTKFIFQAIEELTSHRAHEHDYCHADTASNIPCAHKGTNLIMGHLFCKTHYKQVLHFALNIADLHHAPQEVKEELLRMKGVNIPLGLPTPKL